jgi:hypothetical protein
MMTKIKNKRDFKKLNANRRGNGRKTVHTASARVQGADAKSVAARSGASFLHGFTIDVYETTELNQWGSYEEVVELLSSFISQDLGEDYLSHFAQREDGIHEAVKRFKSSKDLDHDEVDHRSETSDHDYHAPSDSKPRKPWRTKHESRVLEKQQWKAYQRDQVDNSLRRALAIFSAYRTADGRHIRRSYFDQNTWSILGNIAEIAENAFLVSKYNSWTKFQALAHHIDGLDGTRKEWNLLMFILRAKRDWVRVDSSTLPVFIKKGKKSARKHTSKALAKARAASQLNGSHGEKTESDDTVCHVANLVHKLFWVCVRNALWSSQVIGTLWSVCFAMWSVIAFAGGRLQERHYWIMAFTIFIVAYPSYELMQVIRQLIDAELFDCHSALNGSHGEWTESDDVEPQENYDTPGATRVHWDRFPLFNEGRPRVPPRGGNMHVATRAYRERARRRHQVNPERGRHGRGRATRQAEIPVAEVVVDGFVPPGGGDPDQPPPPPSPSGPPPDGGQDPLAVTFTEWLYCKSLENIFFSWMLDLAAKFQLEWLASWVLGIVNSVFGVLPGYVYISPGDPRLTVQQHAAASYYGYSWMREATISEPALHYLWSKTSSSKPSEHLANNCMFILVNEGKFLVDTPLRLQVLTDTVHHFYNLIVLKDYAQRTYSAVRTKAPQRLNGSVYR